MPSPPEAPASRPTLCPAASIVLLRAGAEGVELLMLKRRDSGQFAGAWVFPGGMVSPSDSEPRALARVVGVAARGALASAADEQALVHRVAAVRECFEEAGVLLAVDHQGRALAADRLPGLSAQRAAVNAGALSFNDILETENLYLRAAELPLVAHWITPATLPRRFDTRFYLASMPEGQSVAHDGTEIVDSQWLPPSVVLERARAERMTLVFATEKIVAEMARFTAVPDALAYARGLTHVPVNRPMQALGPAGPRIFRAGDVPYAEIQWSDPAETGASTYELIADQPKPLDRHVTRLLAPNAGRMTGPGTNTYLVGRRELAVIDPGPDIPAHVDAILERGAGRIRWILLTHTHRDHAPAAEALKRATGAPVLGRPAPVGSSVHAPVAIDRVLADDERLELDGITLRALHTPGHASNHLCFLLEQTGMLFSGDHLVQGFTVVIAPPDGNMRAYLEALERLRALELSILAPAHGYLIGEPRAEIERVIRHRLAREDKVRRALEAGGGQGTLETLLPWVYDDVPAALHPLAELSLRAHLDKLVEDGAVALTEAPGTAPLWQLRA